MLKITTLSNRDNSCFECEYGISFFVQVLIFSISNEISFFALTWVTFHETSTCYLSDIVVLCILRRFLKVWGGEQTKEKVAVIIVWEFFVTKKSIFAQTPKSKGCVFQLIKPWIFTIIQVINRSLHVTII